jgi:hypothetical protein
MGRDERRDGKDFLYILGVRAALLIVGKGGPAGYRPRWLRGEGKRTMRM